MSRSSIIVGLDIGTAYIRAIVAEQPKGGAKPIVIGVGAINSTGLRKGIIVDLEGVIGDIAGCIEQAERASGVEISKVMSSINGEHISVQKSKSVIAVSRVDGEISNEDVERAVATAQAVSLSPNKEIIHVIPTNFTVDNEENIKDPIGMHGTKLEVNTFIVSGNQSFIKNLAKCINQAGFEINSFVFTPLAAARAVLSRRQKELGTVLINIGAETTGIAVFEEGCLIHAKVIPIGGAHITNDIAIGLRTSIDAAEKIKRDFGSAVSDDVNKKDKINLKDYDSSGDDVYISRYYLSQIIEARVEEIFDFVNKELKAIGKDGMLPEGAILAGGGVKIPGTVDLAKKILRLPAKIGVPVELGGIVDKVSDPAFATAIGLVFWQIDQSDKESSFSYLPQTWQIIKKVKGWFKLFLP
jgi:cell division protein FtsA